MSILEKINNVVVKPLNIKYKAKKNFKGKDMFNTWCPNIFILAKKNSGKTTTEITIIDKCTGKNTKFIIITSTLEKDPIYKSLISRLGEDRCAAFTSIVDDDGNNIIEQFLNDNNMTEIIGNDDEDKSQIGGSLITPLNNFAKYRRNEEVKNQRGGSKSEDSDSWNHPYPKYVIIMDDLGDSMRNKSVNQLLKTNRHNDVMVIISSQSLTDLNKSARSQIDYMLVFPKLPVDKLKDIKKDLDLSIEFEEFEDIYKEATEDKYNFLYIGRSEPEEEYRKNFNYKFVIKSQ